MDVVSATLWIGLTVALVVANGFFVAAEFALVKIRPGKLDVLVRQQRSGARTAAWLMRRLDHALSACQLGITVASLALGWVGEPAIARLLEPMFSAMGITSPAIVHGLSFAIGFSLITAAHLVLGEQAPKIFAIRRPEPMALWCAVPLRWFYIVSYPFLQALSWATSVLLRRVGITSAEEHEVHDEEELRAMLSQAHAHGELTRTEHRLLNAVFDFDDMICRQIMVPRTRIDFVDVLKPIAEIRHAITHSRHTRYPACEGSLDKLLGFLHIKDVLDIDWDDPAFDIRRVIRPPKYVPETVPVSRLLGLFRSTKQHMAFVVDEHGSVIGMATMENVLELIVGDVQDEFDDELPNIVPDGPGRYLVEGGARIEVINRLLDTEFTSPNADTLAGLLSEIAGRVLVTGDRIDLDGVTAEVLETKNASASRIRLITPNPESVE